MERGLLAQLALGADAVAVPYKQHPDHQFGIDGGAADVAVKGLKLFVKIGQNRCHEHVDAAKKVAPRDHLIKIELVEQSGRYLVDVPLHLSYYDFKSLEEQPSWRRNSTLQTRFTTT